MDYAIKDFGHKIGGAAKDLYNSVSIDELTDAELDSVTRDKIWKRPSINKLLENGADRKTLYFREQIRKAIITKPSYYAKPETFINEIKNVKAFTESLESPDFIGLERVYKDNPHIWNNNMRKIRGINPKYFWLHMDREDFGLTEEEKYKKKIKNNLVVVFFHGRKEPGYHEQFPSFESHDNTFYDGWVQKDFMSNDEICVKVICTIHYFHFKLEGLKEGYYLFDLSERYDQPDGPYDKVEDAIERLNNIVDAATVLHTTKESNKSTKRKVKFSVPKLNAITQSKYVVFDATGKDYLDAFHFYGGEFGNWVADKERQANLNFGYNAFKDLAEVLEIKDADISLGGKLSIAFGARGHGDAAAHYEPLRNVINLTKYSGMGCLAHEWGHALDYYLGKTVFTCGEASSVPEIVEKKAGLHSMTVLMDNILYKDGNIVNGRSDFYKGSKKFDEFYRKYGIGYWSSTTEMFARAFDCYVHDKLESAGVKDNYLSAGSDSFTCIIGGMTYNAYPVGKEREAINKCFDNLFEECKTLGFLSRR